MNDISMEIVPEYLQPGSTHDIGSHTFDAESVIRFGKAYDPQPFHVDAELAKSSMFGALCASGWHTASVWMALQRKSIADHVARLREEGSHWPEYGPSPGMENLKWLRPVFAGDTVTYSNHVIALRKSNSRPDWWILTNQASAKNQHGDPVMQFESSVFLQFCRD